MQKARNVERLRIGVKRAITAIGLVSMALLLSNCGVKAIVIDGDYPTPAVSQIDINLGVYYSPEFRQFAFIEYTEEGEEQYNISSGETHVDLFDSILPSMFSSVQTVNSLEGEELRGLDAVFVPNIEEFQLALPQKTRLGSYEVWIKYNMRLLAPNGDYIADWILTSYGRTPDASFQSVEAGVNDATVGALRDLASSFSLGFSSVPDIKEWLESR